MEHQETGTLVLKLSRIKLVIYIFGSAMFVVVGVWAAGQGKPLLWIANVFFGLCTLVFLVQLHPRASSLTLMRDKFVVRSLFRSYEHSWDEVDQFFAKNIVFNKMVVFNYSEKYIEQQRARKIASTIMGAEAALPDSFGMKPEELASIMNAWKRRTRLST